MQTLLQDLRYGIRMLGKNRGFMAVAVLTLALGIGANTAIFSLIDAVLLKMLPVKDPERLVLLARVNPQGAGEGFTYPQFEQLRDHNQVFSDIFAFAYRRTSVRVDGKAEEALVQLASGQYFSALGINTLLGHTFTASDNQAAGGSAQGAVAVISYGFWKRRFALDPSVLGKSITIGGTPFVIVGVTPPGFVGVSLDYAVDVWVPISMQAQLDDQPLPNSTGIHWVRIMARLKPGISRPQAAASVNVIFQQHLRALNAPGTLSQRVELTPGSKPVSGMRGVLSRPLLVLMVIVVLILLIACANIANLLLAKAAARQKEITVRVALGASRGRVIRQLLTESILLAVLGGGLGILLAMWGSDLLMALTFNQVLLQGPVPPPLTFHMGTRILGFTALISVLTGILFGLAPALEATRLDLVSALKETTRGPGASRRRLGLDKLLLISQLAVSMVLLIAAGLFVRSFQKLGEVDLGFNPNHVVQLKFTINQTTYTDAQLSTMWNQMLEKIKATPGVISASMSTPGLFSYSTFQTSMNIEGPARSDDSRVHVLTVTPGFFKTMEIPLLWGRAFDPQDNANAPRVVVINETVARDYFHGKDPIGQRVHLYGEPGPVEVVGLAKDTKYDNPLQKAPGIVYTPMPQAKGPVYRFRVFEARTAGHAASLISDLRRAVQAVDSSLPVDVHTLTDLVNQSLFVQHLIARLTGLFGILGLLLACVGIYGLMSYAVARRTNEIGIRMALGAQPNQVLWLVLRETIGLVLIGVAIGLSAAFATTRLVSSMLFGLTATDPLTILVTTVLLVGVAALAGYVPARRASRVDPMVALRYE